MNVRGSCYCKAVTFRAEVAAERVQVCHCTDCQTLSGSAFRVVVPALAGTFEILEGEPGRFVKTAESGRQREQGFCARCGTPLYSAAVGDTGAVSLRVGVLAERDRLEPTRQIWARSARAWIDGLPALPRLERQ